jgi:hypothetical protein
VTLEQGKSPSIPLLQRGDNYTSLWKGRLGGILRSYFLNNFVAKTLGRNPAFILDSRFHACALKRYGAQARE